jgi:uncharacterized protein YkwD
MRPFLFGLLLFLAALCAAPLHASDSQGDVEKQTFKLINAYRDRAGLPPLRWNDDIATIARAHSRDMATGDVVELRAIEHVLARALETGDERLELADAVVEAAVAEVDVAARAVQMWLHSPHHLKNIRGDYNFSGIGVWRSKDGALYFTQLFLKTARPGE